MPFDMPTDSRYAHGAYKNFADGTIGIDPFARKRLESDDFADELVCVTVGVGETPFSLASKLYGSSRLYWVVCECIHQNNPFLNLIPGKKLLLPTNDSLRDYLAGEEDPL